jgi:signal transduction histidine kinase
VSIRLCCTEQHLSLTVEDDGCGFDMASASLSDLVRSHHFGLVGIHEWARLAQGEVEIRTRLAGGTIVRLRAPIGSGHHTQVPHHKHDTISAYPSNAQ